MMCCVVESRCCYLSLSSRNFVSILKFGPASLSVKVGFRIPTAKKRSSPLIPYYVYFLPCLTLLTQLLQQRISFATAFLLRPISTHAGSARLLQCCSQSVRKIAHIPLEINIYHLYNISYFIIGSIIPRHQDHSPASLMVAGLRISDESANHQW